MALEIYYLVFLGCSPVLIFVIHMIVARLLYLWKPNFPPLLSPIWSIFIGFFIIAFLAWQYYLGLLPDQWERFWAVTYGFVTYLSLSVSYFILFAMTEAARRIRILQDLYFMGKVSLSDLSSGYGATNMLSVRLERMVGLKQLKKCGDRYYIERKFLFFVAQIIFFWSKLLKFPEE